MFLKFDSRSGYIFTFAEYDLQVVKHKRQLYFFFRPVSSIFILVHLLFLFFFFQVFVCDLNSYLIDSLIIISILSLKWIVE